jgi:transposase
MYLVHQTDKRSGLTYVYESISFRDKVTKKTYCKRKLIGRWNSDTQQIEPTDGRMRKSKEKKDKPQPKSKTNSFEYSRKYFGATYLLESISHKIGLTADLKRCFPNAYLQILSLAFYFILEDKNPLYRFEKWSHTHKHPFEKNIPSQRSSELFQSISQNNIHNFLKLQENRRDENEYWVYDTTSISSYSETLKHVQYGHNKDNDDLPQINLALVFGDQSNLPFYYKKLPGNTPDVKTLKGLTAELESHEFKQLKMILDKGFFSIENINEMLLDNIKFVIATKITTKIIQDELDRIYNDFINIQYFNENFNLYSKTVTLDWICSSNSGKVKNKKTSKLHIHFYYNINRMAEEQSRFDKKLAESRKELLSGKLVRDNENFYKKYFIESNTSDGEYKLTYNFKEINKKKKYFGYFALLSNEKITSKRAIELYRNKDLIEKAFYDIKDRLNFRRFLVSSEESLDGKLFVAFVSLILLSYIMKKMHDKDIVKDYTLNDILDKLDIIECFNAPKKKMIIGEILEKQKQIFIDMEVDIPM